MCMSGAVELLYLIGSIHPPPIAIRSEKRMRAPYGGRNLCSMQAYEVEDVW
jgi:hypothetical protein